MTTAERNLLAADTGMGAVTLRVADLDAMIRYYRDGVTLDVLRHDGPTAVLGRGRTPIVILEHAPELRHAAPREAGLYHTAILFDTRQALATAILSVASRYPGTFTGSADHLVSEAFYFTDPEGNGVELYFDRDRSTWSWVHGQVEMATIFLDPNGYLAEHLGEAGSDAATTGDRLGSAVVGHVHLSVGDVERAREFYVRRLGFETTAAFGSQALFVSAGGYHHHMAMNTWNSAGGGGSRSVSARSRSSCRPPTTSGSWASGCGTTTSRPATTGGRWRSTIRGRTSSRCAHSSESRAGFYRTSR